MAQRGGRDLGKCARRVMAKLFSDELAQRFSWLGSRGEKESFLNSVFKNIVFGENDNPITLYISYSILNFTYFPSEF